MRLLSDGKPCPGQSGAALITSLVFLTVLTILGMSTLGTALLESRMAGNARDRNLAFQAAESALRDAERYIRFSGRVVGPQDVGVVNEGYEETAACSSGNCAAQTCTHGICYKVPNMKDPCSTDPTTGNDIWAQGNTNLWNNALQYYRSTTVGKGVGLAGRALGVGGGYVAPAQLPLVRRQPEYLIESFPENCNVYANVYYYRISARAYGVRNGTRVILQEIYKPL
ncbi:MAG: PilX N-terminal domain-containing pilus assembly protein [Pseudomonadota bacterium]|nr:PilX N-terminal domain-containing pilus assembly protein [Pseudomonadota bacterium]MDP1902844.1 PilX N-terminal domain-containing pilus assembly protein [Pseudomonadota bacterium]MDP2352842.1 PilX N-terminal domain-containing pilus assembly protein [Pseudomonadota bacterium]